MLQQFRKQARRLASISLVIFVLPLVSVFCMNCFSEHIGQAQTKAIANASHTPVQTLADNGVDHSCCGSTGTSTQKDGVADNCCAQQQSTDNSSLFVAAQYDFKFDLVLLESSYPRTVKTTSITHGTAYKPLYVAHASLSFRNPVLLN